MLAIRRLLAFFYMWSTICIRASDVEGESSIGIPSGRPLRSCGVAPVKPRLDKDVQIAIAIPYSWPWMAALCGPAYSSDTILSCTQYGLGTVVGGRWILALYATYSQELVAKMQVRTGMHSWIRSDEKGSRLYNITRIYAYPDVSPPNGWDTALSLIELSSEVEYNEHVQPICLAAHDHLLQNNHTDAWVTGWRLGMDDGAERNMSQWHIRAVKNFLPNGPFLYFAEEDHYARMTAGAPLLRRVGQRWYQFGVVGLDMSYATAFARITYYCDWIAEVSRGEVLCSPKTAMPEP